METENSREKKVTIGLPFMNDEKHLGLALQSILSQSYKDWILILINDKSGDTSAKIAEEFYQKEKNRVILINDGLNKGLPARLNQIASFCTTPYLFRMDADDVMFKDRIRIQLDYLENNDVDVIGSSVVVIDEDNKIKGIRESNPRRPISKQIFKNSFFAHPSVAGKSIWFKKNPYNEKLKRSQDFDLWSRTYSNSKFETIKQPLLFYREKNIFNVSKYKSNQFYRRKIIQQFQRDGVVTNWQMVVAFLLSHTKFLFYYLLHSFGRFNFVSSVLRNSNSKFNDESIISELNYFLKRK